MRTSSSTQLARLLAFGAAITASIAAAAGLFVPGLYHDSEGWVRQAKASDLTTLALAVPLLVTALLRARSSDDFSRLIALGVLGYLAYGYAIFAFAIETNALSFLHYAVLGLSVWALLLTLVEREPGSSEANPSPDLPRRTTALFLVAVAGLFGVMWIGEIATAISTGAPAPAVAALGLVTNPVWAIDLTVALPLFAVAGVLLLRRAADAERLAIPVLMFIVVMGASILVIFAFDARAGASVPVSPVVIVGATVAISAALIGVAWRHDGSRRVVPARSVQVGLG
jgi:hypothetical protein